MNQNSLERIFRNGSDGKRRFSAINKTGERFSNLCKSLIQDNGDFSSIHLHSGFGLPKNGELPIRLPVILVPALEIMRKLLEQGINPPRLVIYQATSAISQINEIPREDATTIATLMEARLHSFIRQNFSELLPFIDIYFGEKESDTDILETIISYSNQVDEALGKSGRSSHFSQCEKRHSNGNNSYALYVTANTLYNGGFKEYPFHNTDDPKNIIPIGGRSETKFFEILLQTQTSIRDIFPLITQVGAFPTYYYRPEGDVRSFEELPKFHSGDIKAHPDIQKDLQVLFPYSL